MADVKWIKLNTDMFDNAKIKYLRTLPEGDKIVLIWVMLLSKAGKCNANGYIFLTENIPYTKDMLASEFDFEITTIQLALTSLMKLGMINLDESNLCVAGWEYHQNVEGLERIREQTRKRVAKHRENQRLLKDNVDSNVTGNITVTDGNAIEGDRDRDIDIDIERDRDRDINTISKDIVSSTFVLRIISEWNSLDLTSKLTKINQGTNRYKMLKARVKQYGEDEIVKAITEVNKSKFLKGQAKDFEITFDWFIRPNNFLKVLEGNYRDKEDENGGTEQDNKKSEGKWDKYNFG